MSIVGGIELSGMSTIAVVPPAPAAAVAVANPSQSVRPGSLTWTWLSTNPGNTNRWPASRTSTPLAVRRHERPPR